MPKRHRRTMKGGFWESLSQGFSDVWDKTKKATSDAYASVTTGSTAPSTSYYQPTQTSPPPSSMYSQPSSMYSQPSMSTTNSTGYMGGKTKKRRMRGGFKDNTSTTGLAASASSFSGQTAKPHNWVGGKSRRRRGRKSRRHRY